MFAKPAKPKISGRGIAAGGARRRRVVLAAAMVGLQGYLAFDAWGTATWTNAGGGTWSTSSNWNDGVPTDTAVFGPANDSYTVDFSGNASVQTLNMVAGSDPSLNIGGETLTAGQVNVGGEINGQAATGSLGVESGTLSSSTINVGGGSGSGVLDQSGGYINPGMVNVESGGTVSQTGGTDVFSGITLGGTSPALYDLEFGTVTLSTLTINSGGDLQAGYTAEYNFWFFAGTVTVNAGGALHLADADVGGGDANTFATLNVNGGTVGSVDLIVTGAYNYTSGNTSALTLDLDEGATTTVGNWAIAGLYADSSVPLTIAAGQSITASGSEIVGAGDTSTLNQTGGTNSAEVLLLSDSIIGNGVYNLSNGTLDISSTEWIGEINIGTLNQSGGTNTLPGVAAINLGWGNGTVGYYTLSGGIVSTSTLNVGMGYNFGQFTGGGSGTFVQTGGTAQVGTLSVSVNSLSSGTYSLSGSALLSVSGSESIGAVAREDPVPEPSSKPAARTRIRVR